MKYCLLFIVLLGTVSCDLAPKKSIVYRSGNKTSTTTSVSSKEQNEFYTLAEQDKINKRKVTAEVLTYLLNDTDPDETHTGAVIENVSNSDIIVRLVGVTNNEIYNLPVGRQSKNQFVIRKGNYTLKAKVCGANYYSQKNIQDPLILKLSAN